MWLADVEETDGFEEVIRRHSPRNPFPKKSHVPVKMRRHARASLVHCLSSERKEQDRAFRETQEGRFLAGVAHLDERVRRVVLVKPVKIGESLSRQKERYTPRGLQ